MLVLEAVIITRLQALTYVMGAYPVQVHAYIGRTRIGASSVD